MTATDAFEGMEGPQFILDEVTRAHFVRYAGASGDFNPIHLDESYARCAGYPGVFGQGMFTAGILGRYVTDWFGAGSVRRFRVRFAGQVWPGEKLVCSGKVTRVYEQDGERRADAELQVTNGEGDTKIVGSASVILG